MWDRYWTWHHTYIHCCGDVRSHWTVLFNCDLNGQHSSRCTRTILSSLSGVDVMLSSLINVSLAEQETPLSDAQSTSHRVFVCPVCPESWNRANKLCCCWPDFRRNDVFSRDKPSYVQFKRTPFCTKKNIQCVTILKQC